MNILRRSLRFTLGLLAFGLLFTAATYAAPPSVAGQILVKPAKGTTEVDLHALLSFHGGGEVDRIPGLDVRIVRVPARALEAVLAALARNPKIEFAEPDFIAQANATANDPHYGNQWHLAKIQAPSAWDVTTGTASTVIAVIDTGANYSHPDLQGKLLAGYDFVNSDSDPSDDNGHGTGVSGTAAAASNNAIGVASIAWACPVMPLKVLDAAGSGSYSNIAKAINYAADNGARVINLSLGGSSNSLTLQNAVNYAWNKGVVLVAAAGNNGNNTPVYPAACNNVVAVSATNSSDAIPTWSSYGSYVDVSAPGESILTTWGGDYAYVSGTSFSSPVTAATIALMISIQPKLTNSQTVDLLLKNADDLGAIGYDVYYGYGRVNASRAVYAARNAITADTTAPLVTIGSPANGAIVSGTVSISASATDNVGVTKMEILIDGALVAQGTAATISYSWNTPNVANGAHTIQARAYDAANNVGSASISVSVQNSTTADTTAPTVAITSPADGSTVSSTVKIYVSSSDNVGVTKVDLYLDGALFGSSTSATPVFSWSTRRAANGSHKLQAYAYDAAGNIGASSVVTVYK